MYYPANYFPEYFSYMVEDLPDHKDEYYSFLPKPPKEFERLDAHVTGITKSDGVITFTSKGTYDCVEIKGGFNSSDPATINYSWSILLPPGGSVSYKLPEIPQLLVDMFNYPLPSAWNTNIHVVIHEYSGVSGYDDYFKETYINTLAHWQGYQSWRTHSVEQLVRSEWFTPTGGRMKSTNGRAASEPSGIRYLENLQTGY